MVVVRDRFSRVQAVQTRSRVVLTGGLGDVSAAGCAAPAGWSGRAGWVVGPSAARSDGVATQRPSAVAHKSDRSHRRMVLQPSAGEGGQPCHSSGPHNPIEDAAPQTAVWTGRAGRGLPGGAGPSAPASAKRGIEFSRPENSACFENVGSFRICRWRGITVAGAARHWPAFTAGFEDGSTLAAMKFGANLVGLAVADGTP